jgi:hypothetical protein
MSSWPFCVSSRARLFGHDWTCLGSFFHLHLCQICLASHPVCWVRRLLIGINNDWLCRQTKKTSDYEEELTDVLLLSVSNNNSGQLEDNMANFLDHRQNCIHASIRMLFLPRMTTTMMIMIMTKPHPLSSQNHTQ